MTRRLNDNYLLTHLDKHRIACYTAYIGWYWGDNQIRIRLHHHSDGLEVSVIHLYLIRHVPGKTNISEITAYSRLVDRAKADCKYTYQ